MRVNFSGQLGTNINGGLSNSTTIVSTPITLLNDPTQPLEASSKRYTDNIVSNLDANNIKTGTVDAARLPAYTGDMLVPSGSGTLALATSSVPPDVYSKVNVNSKGIVTSTATLNNDDIPVISFSKITADRPTTLSGYGISDGVSSNGGMLAGIVSLNNDPVQNLEASNKQYVDNVAAANYGIMVGDIIRRPSNVTPSGFLRCNGGQVDRTTYSALYAVIGDIYNPTNTSRLGGGKPWSLQYGINTTQTSDITGWSTSGNSVLPVALAEGSVVITNSKVYAIGGSTANGSIPYVYRADINGSGVIGTWTDTRDIYTDNLSGNGNRTLQSDIVTLTITGKGGDGGSDTTVNLTGIQNGTIPVGPTSVTITGKGGDGTTTNTPYNTTLTGTNSGTIPSSTAPISVSITGKGGDGGGSALLPGSGKPWKQQYDINTEQSTDITGWTTGTSLPGVLAYSQAIVTKNRVYLLGGHNRTGYIATVYTAPINSDGTLGTWTTGTSLPGVLAYSHAIVTKNRVYLLGGGNGSFVSTVYTAPILGGLNDYSPYYDGTFTPTDSTKFKLPDYTAQSTNGSYFYIKS